MVAHDQIALITSTSRYFKYIIRHKGIVFRQNDTFFVVHRTVKGVEIITLDEFLTTRKLLKIKRYKLKHDVDISELVRTKQYNRYKLINNNCENFCNDFINEFSTQHRSEYSEQIMFWLIAGAVVFTAGISAAFLGIGWLTIVCTLIVFLPVIILIKSNYDYVK